MKISTIATMALGLFPLPPLAAQVVLSQADQSLRKDVRIQVERQRRMSASGDAAATPAPGCSEAVALAAIDDLAPRMDPSRAAVNAKIARAIASVAARCPTSPVKVRAVQGLSEGLSSSYRATTAEVARRIAELCAGDPACAKAAIQSIDAKMTLFSTDASIVDMAGDIAAVVEKAPAPEVKRRAVRVLTLYLRASDAATAKALSAAVSKAVLSRDCPEPVAMDAIEFLAIRLNPQYDRANGDIAQAIFDIARACPSSKAKTYAARVLSRGLDRSREAATVAVARKMVELCGGDAACAKAAVETLGDELDTSYLATVGLAGNIADIVERAPSPEVREAATRKLTQARVSDVGREPTAVEAVEAAKKRVASCGPGLSKK